MMLQPPYLRNRMISETFQLFSKWNNGHYNQTPSYFNQSNVQYITLKKCEFFSVDDFQKSSTKLSLVDD